MNSTVTDEHGVTTRVVQDVDEFERLKPEWDILLEESGLSPFQSFEYLRAWWRHFGESNRNARLHIVLTSRGRETLGIAPLFLERAGACRLCRFRRLAFLGRETSDYLDLLIRRGEERVCVENLARHLAESSSLFDVIMLEDLSDRSAVTDLLYERLTREHFHGVRFVNEQCPRTRLFDTWEHTLASLKTDTRREIRRRERNLNKHFSVQTEIVEGGENLMGDVDDFIAMHQERWTNAGHEGVFADRRVAALHREIAGPFSRRGWLFLAFLSVDGKRAVAQYGYTFRSELLIFLGGASTLPALHRYSPGKVLTGYCMQEAVRRGLTVYDFMRGTERYKYDFDGVDVPNWTMRLYSGPSRGTEHKIRFDDLLRPLQRRGRRERLLWGQARAQHALVSVHTARHIVVRLWRNIADGLGKLSGPAMGAGQDDHRKGGYGGE